MLRRLRWELSRACQYLWYRIVMYFNQKNRFEIVKCQGIHKIKQRKLSFPPSFIKVGDEDCWLCFLFYFIWCWELLFLLGRNCIQSCVKIIVSYFNTWEGGYYGFIRWIFHVVFSIYKILGNKKLVNNITREHQDLGTSRLFLLEIFIKWDIDLFFN